VNTIWHEAPAGSTAAKPSNHRLTCFDSVSDLHRACAHALEHQIRLALAERGQAFLALAGGSTPLPAYRLLAKADLDWASVTIVPTDERWVGSQDPACNLSQLRQCFAARFEIQWLSLVPENLPADKISVSAHSAIKTLAGMPMPFDAVLLGMGLDAHTASLFPGAEHLSEALDLQGIVSAVAITPEPLPKEAPFARVSLTAARLLHSHYVILAITGQAKREVFAKAELADTAALPISRLLHAPGAALDVFWSS
jgi:6-phosphogluconolactonase